MARERSSKQGNLRERIAQIAARIMAEDGIDDFGYAKRKAARQLGALDARMMPDNDEIEQALLAYRSLYQRGEHAPVLAELRSLALQIMRRLERFKPHLVGPVLNGIAGKYSGIDLHLFADSPKEFELHLINQGTRFRTNQNRVYLNDVEIRVPVYSFEFDGVEFRALLFDVDHLRRVLKTSPAGRAVERASLAAVALLVDTGS